MAEEVKDFWKWPESGWINPHIDIVGGELITAGVDVGSVSTQAVIMIDGELYAYSNTRTGFNSPDSAKKGLSLALKDTGITIENIDYCVGTGYGRVNVPMAQQAITEIACHARGTHFFYGPSVRTIIDMGGQDCKAIRIDDEGKVMKFIMNDKCAAGTGRGMEVFADLIRVPIWEIGPRSFKTDKKPKPISSTCVVFAKSEVINLLEMGVSESDVISAYCMAMAHRVVSLVNRLGVEDEVCITGGIAKNEGVVKRIEQELGVKIMKKKWHKPVYHERGYPFDTQIIGASGAALFALDQLRQRIIQSNNKTID